MNSAPEPTKQHHVPTPPEELLARVKNRSAKTRQHRLLGGGGSLVVVLVLVLVGVLIPEGSARPQQSSHRPGQVFVSDRIGSAYELGANETPAPPAPSSVKQAVENAEVGFSLDLLNNLAISSDSSDSSDVLVSPSSLATALAMLELGAAASTEQGIAATLHTAGLSAAQQAAGWHGLAALLAAETSTTGTNLRHEPELNIANALFLQEHFAALPAFVRALSREFQTGLWETDFQNDLTGATNAINQWTSENTKGLIKQLFSPGALSPFPRLVIAAAVYSRARLAHKCENATADRPFYLATGATESVPFMTSPPSSSLKDMTLDATTDSQYTALELPYTGKKLSALVVMPTKSSLSSFVSSLTPASLEQIVNGMSPEIGPVSMPTFTLRSDNQLDQTLKSMGMSQAFGPMADFTRIIKYPPLVVQAVEQHAYLQVTPKGTTAAAATGISVGPTAMRAYTQPVVIDHPFLFLVRDDATGAILFESMVENPAS